MSSTRVDPTTGQFIDPLFAIMIAAGVAETLVIWVHNEFPSTLALCTVTLGYVNLLLSWFGYHKSVFDKPIEGSLRFIVTVALLPLYLLTIILYDKETLYIAGTYLLIFFLWTVWEVLKKFEHRESINFLRMVFRFFNVLMFVAFLIQVVGEIAWLEPSMPEWTRGSAGDSVSLGLIAIAIFSLRVSKSMRVDGSPAFRIKQEICALLFGRRESTQSKQSA